VLVILRRASHVPAGGAAGFDGALGYAGFAHHPRKMLDHDGEQFAIIFWMNVIQRHSRWWR